MTSDPRVQEYSVDPVTKRILFKVFNAYFYEFTEVARGRMRNTARWKKGAEGRMPASQIFVPPDVFAYMAKMAYGIAKDRFKPIPKEDLPPGQISEEDLDEIIHMPSPLELTNEGERQPGYACADFIPEPTAPPGSTKSRKTPYRNKVTRRGRRVTQTPLFT